MATIRGLLARAAADVRRDLGEGRGFLWWPVAVGIGAAVYFEMPWEPSTGAAAGGAACGLMAAAALRLRLGRVPFPAVLAVLAILGFALAKLAVVLHDAPRLAGQRTFLVEGVVERVEDRAGRGFRLVLRPVRMDPAPRGGMPRRMRITLRGLDEAPVPGQGLRVRARLGPPQSPLLPGSYDFARVAYFQEIGGVGFSLGTAEPVAVPGEPDRLAAAAAAVERFRLSVSRRIREALPGDTGAIAAALIVGDRGSIDPVTDDAMRVSGLSHVLSISGLHMALVAAFLFGGLRALLAAVPPLALRFPIKKIAALAALGGTAGYLVISGMGVPTQRSAVMIAVALAAILIDRQPVSLRVVAAAALVVLALQPEAVLDPGAQMSFAAVTALVAGFEVVAARRTPPAVDINPLVRGFDTAVRWIGASLLTSLIAGLATGPIALHHFNRIAPLGLVANLAATPLVSFVIMPFALAAALLMPLGLDALPLAVMGAGIDGMIGIAEVVAAWTPAGGTIGRPAPAGTVAVVAGLIWLCLWRGTVRLAGLAVIAAGLALLPLAARPDLIVAGDGRTALLVRPDGSLALLGTPDPFQTGLWLAALGDPRDPADPTLVRGVGCDPEACVLDAERGPATAALVLKPAAFGEECFASRLVISALEAPPWCSGRTTLIDGADLSDAGARTYDIPPDGWSAPDGLVLVEEARAIPAVRRPWQGE